MFLVSMFLIGCLAGWIASTLACILLAPVTFQGIVHCRHCHHVFPRWSHWFRPWPLKCTSCSRRDSLWPWLSAGATGAVFAGFTWMLIRANCQSIEEVQPSGSLTTGRLPFHLWLIFLLVLVTLTDLLDYVISDIVVIVGVVSAVVLAVFSGELQMIHVWVNWDEAIPGLRGPYLPTWMDQHQHLHGLVWSLAGMATGAGLLWILRLSAQLVLGTPAVGFGDVTMMAMVGAFVGWQPTLCIIALAPLAGMVVGPVIRWITGRSFVAFGPYLAVSTLIILCSWSTIWRDWSLRTVFSHWPSVVGLVAGAVVVLTLLLLVVRGFRSLPTSAMRR
ncbi:MAG: prepilin peptidase [Planctomyces sp.]|nr:prepilin peptidase [Planctomyces sp.]